MLACSLNQYKTWKKNTTKYSPVFILFPDQESLKISQGSWVVLRILTQLCISLKVEICHQTSGVGNRSLGKSLTRPSLCIRPRGYTQREHKTMLTLDFDFYGIHLRAFSYALSCWPYKAVCVQASLRCTKTQAFHWYPLFLLDRHLFLKYILKLEVLKYCIISKS